MITDIIFSIDHNIISSGVLQMILYLSYLYHIELYLHTIICKFIGNIICMVLCKFPHKCDMFVYNNVNYMFVIIGIVSIYYVYIIKIYVIIDIGLYILYIMIDM